jgi:predicted O-methyltransferase YrrM
LQQVRPSNIIEWGPGASTQIMHEECPEANIWTIEHDPKWAAMVQGFPGLTVYEVPATRRHAAYGAACLRPGKVFDLAFIDGRRRVECCLWACAVLSPTGVALLHDSHRVNYSPIMPVIDVLEEIEDTLVFRPARHIDWLKTLERLGE